MNMSYEFYLGRYKANGTYLFEDILRWDDYRLETAHDFVQWLFPDETGGVNPKAPRMTKKDYEVLRASKNVRRNIVKATLRMLDFYGFKVYRDFKGDISLKQIKPLYRKERGHIVGLYSHHNYLRITRMIKFLKEMKLDYLSSLVFYMCCLAMRDKSLKDEIGRSFEYWRRSYVKS